MNSLMTVRPVKPAFGYIGGKRNSAKRIVPMIEATPHTSYAEPFVGGGGIFLRRSLVPAAEAINDISGDVVTFFRVLQEHYDLFIRHLRFRVTSRDEFERLLAIPADRLTDFQRAARFLYLQRNAFGGKVEGRNFGVSPGLGARFNVVKLEEQLEALARRFASVVIERLHYGDFIRRYDREGALFYLDPPYWGCEEDYGQDVFGRADFERLAEQLRSIKGRFLLSINDTPGVRQVFAGFPMQSLDVSYTISAAAPGKFGELIIGG